MVKVYTRTGDDGTTHCFKSGRISKDDQLLEAIGSVDELNSQIGLLLSWLQTGTLQKSETNEIQSTQDRLFDLGGALATWSTEKQFTELVQRIDEKPLEKWIDRMDEELSELRQFILPGGTVESAQAQICRAVCRRAERHVVGFYHSVDDDAKTVKNGVAQLMRYLNRLSDYLFVLARYLNKKSGHADVVWKNENPQGD